MKAFGLAGKLISGTKWYVVQLELDSLDPLRRPIMSKTQKRYIEDWLKEQIGDNIIEFWDTDNFGRYAFVMEKDAFIFKMRWQ